MSKYIPLPPPQETESVPLYLQNELQKISQATDIIEERLDTDKITKHLSMLNLQVNKNIRLAGRNRHNNFW